MSYMQNLFSYDKKSEFYSKCDSKPLDSLEQGGEII